MARPIWLLLCLVVFLHAPSSCYSTAAQKEVVKVEDICSEHPNPSFCIAVLSSSSNSTANATAGAGAGAGAADLRTLAEHVLTMAKANATNALKQIKSKMESLRNEGPDAITKQYYKSCYMRYENALSDLDKAQQAFASRDYAGMKINTAAAIMAHADDCVSGPPDDELFHTTGVQQQGGSSQSSGVLDEMLGAFAILGYYLGRVAVRH